MSNLTILGDTSGSVVLQAPAVSGSTTITLAPQSGTLNVAGPAFSAYKTGSQTLGSSTYTKLLFETEEFDTNNNFANSTFTPTVAGYYQINAAFQVGAFFTTGNLAIYKNGSRYKQGFSTGNVDGTSGLFTANTLVYCNGSTDYIEAYGFIRGGQALDAGIAFTYFNGCLLRAA